MIEQGDGGALKMYVTRELLRMRKEHRELFAYGEYQAVAVTGSLKKHVVAVGRRHNSQWAIACVPRQTLAVVGNGRYAKGNVWDATTLRLPKDAPSEFVNVLTGNRVSSVRGRVDVATCLADVPVGILVGSD
jgi:maltooligosyltrehalose synthase